MVSVEQMVSQIHWVDGVLKKKNPVLEAVCSQVHLNTMTVDHLLTRIDPVEETDRLCFVWLDRQLII